MKSKKIALVYGGKGTESEVSKMSMIDIKEAIIKIGYNVECFDFDKYIFKRIQEEKIDLVYNGMYGEEGEGGQLPAALSVMEILFTHSNFLSSFIAFDKKLTKNIIKELGISTKEFLVCSKNHINNGEWKKSIKKEKSFKDVVDFFIKPSRDGSSIDTFPANFDSDFSSYKFKTKSEDIIIEEAVKKPRELFVTILDNKVLGTIESVPKLEFYNYESKYTPGQSFHKFPDDLDLKLIKNIESDALNLHKKIGLNCISRVDFLLDSNGNYFLSEINNNPGMTKMSLVPDTAKLKGIEFAEIVKIIIDNAILR